jgi:hypothetical protein
MPRDDSIVGTALTVAVIILGGLSLLLWVVG